MSLERSVPKRGKKHSEKIHDFSFFMPKNNIKKPFPEGEDSIAQRASLSYHYAKYILKQPFPKRENAIATDHVLSLYYAMDVLHGPFPKGEKAIATDNTIYTLYKVFLEKFWKREKKTASNTTIHKKNKSKILTL